MPSFYYGGSSIVNAYYGSSSVYAIYFGSTLIYGGSSPAPATDYLVHLANATNTKSPYTFLAPRLQRDNTEFDDFLYNPEIEGEDILFIANPYVDKGIIPNVFTFSHAYAGTGSTGSSMYDIINWTFSNYASNIRVLYPSIITSGVMAVCIASSSLQSSGVSSNINVDIAYSVYEGMSRSLFASATASPSTSSSYFTLSQFNTTSEFSSFLSAYPTLYGHYLKVVGKYQNMASIRSSTFSSTIYINSSAVSNNTFISAGTTTTGTIKLSYLEGSKRIQLVVAGGRTGGASFTVWISSMTIL